MITDFSFAARCFTRGFKGKIELYLLQKMKVNWILENCETFSNILAMRDEIVRQGHRVKLIDYTILKENDY